MGEFTRTQLRLYHINWESAHLLVVQSCMCYISMCLKRSQGSAPASSSFTSASFNRTDQLHPMSQRLLDYALDDALDHFGYLGSKFESAVADITVLAEDIRRHSEIWDHVYIPARWKIGTKPRWPSARHDLLLYILVAFAPDSIMSAFFCDNALKPKEGTNPLVYAAHFNKDEHARTLLSRGAKLDHRGWETIGFRQSLPIEVAFENRHYAMITHFVEEGSPVPPRIFTDSFFQCNRLLDDIPSSIARVLVQADDFAENINNCLNEAAWRAMQTSDYLSMFRNTTEQDLIAIIRRFIQVTDEHFTPNAIREAFFRFTIAQGYFSAAQYLVTLGTPVHSDILVKLHHPSGRWKTVPMIRFLVENGADVLVHTSDRDSVLHTVLCAPSENIYSIDDDVDEEDILGVVKLLIGYGCDPLEADSRGSSPLHITVEQGYISVARYLLTLSVPLPHDLLVTLNRDQWCWKTLPMIRFLVENGVNILARASDGDSVLHIVLQSLYDDNEVLETVKLLVGYGCDPLAANSRGNTPLHIALEQGRTSTAQCLLTLGTPLPPDLLVTSNPDRLRWNRVSIIRFLVENGVDVLARASGGDSVLHIMLQSYDDEALEAVKFLVGCGCNPLEANSLGSTPLYIAVKRGHISTTRYLLSLGAPLPSDLLVTVKGYRLNRITAPMIHLVENGVDIRARHNDGDFLLYTVLQSIYDENEALETTKLLVDYGCSHLEADSDGKTPLHIAVERGHISAARYLLTLGAPLPPDILVTLKGYQWVSRTAPMIRFLVENGVNILASASDGDSVLHVVLQSLYDDNEVLETVKLLVGYGCDPLAANSRGNTPLHIALEQGHTSTAQYLLTLGTPLAPDLLTTLKGYWSSKTASIIRFLVENGVDVLARASDGDSMLHIALQSLYEDNEAFETVKLLVDHGCDPLEANPSGNTPLHIAVERGHMSVARYLLTLGASLPPDLLVTLKSWTSWTSWTTAPIIMIPFLVENGVDVCARTGNGDSVLHIALWSFYDDDDLVLGAVKLLVNSYGCDPLEANARGNTPLRIAVEKGYISVARYLLTLGAAVPPDILVTLKNWSPLGRRTAPMIHLLVENGVDIRAHTSNGDSLFHIVLQSFHGENEALEAMKLLVGYGCSHLEANSRGKTPLHIAVESGRISAARYLLTLGASLPPDLLVISKCYWSGRSAAPMIHLLVENGVDIRARTSDGDSLLHTVLQSIHGENKALEAMKLLVGYGCSHLEANSHGKTPLHIAVERGYVSAARYLLTLGAPPPPDLLQVVISKYRLLWSGQSTTDPLPR